MRWYAKPRLKIGDYRRCYAWLPTVVGDEWIWFEAYEQLAHPIVPIWTLPELTQERLKTLPDRRLLPSGV